MGYEVHITRKTNWFEEDGLPISCNEWLQYVLNDPEMRADGYAKAPLPGNSTLQIDHPGIADGQLILVIESAEIWRGSRTLRIE